MKNKRGRPLGFRLSEESKRAISSSKTGQRHKQSTRDKISRTLIIYFRNKNPLSEEMANEYCRCDNDYLCEWFNDIQEDLDNTDDVKTERAMRNTRKIEIDYGQNIEYFSHAMTPETIVLFKEFCKENNIESEDVDAILGEE